MPAPTPLKTWQFNVNAPLRSTGAALGDNRQLLRAIKSALLGFAASPWQVDYSCDGVSAGAPGDGVDRWTSDASLVWGTGAHSWIVLRQPGLGATTDLLIDLRYGTSDQAAISLAVDGFVGGSTGAAPGASDATSGLARDDRWCRGSDTSAFNCALHVMQSTDGQCTRVGVFENTIPKMYVQIDRVRDPIPAAAGAVFACWFGRYAFQGAEVRDAPLWYFYQHQLGNPFGDAQAFRAGTIRHAGGDLNVSLLCETAGSASPAILSQRPAKLNQLESATYALVPCAYYCVSPASLLGRAFDLWWGDENAPNGRGYPTDAAPAFVHWRNAVVPWNGTSMLTA